MHSETIAVVGSARPTRGAVGIAQGVYGARGNLELIACDATDGLWVFWFNSDLADDPLTTPDVPPGCWSTGLHFASGARYRDTQIVQSPLGPDHLEVLALTEAGVLQSWYWSPGPGFQRRKPDAAVGVARFALAHEDGALTVTVADADGTQRQVSSTPEGYPDRRWRTTDQGPGLDTDATADVVAAGVPLATIMPDTARRTISRRRGGTVELTWRDADGAIRHLGVPAA